MGKLVRDLQRNGFCVERTGSGHWKVTHPDVVDSVILSFSPSVGNFKKSIARLRKIGYDK
jgi:predicted RNA binding protein YcfA (HicA-like mRNA interferase family)